MKQIKKLIVGMILILLAVTATAFAAESMDEITMLNRLDIIRGYEDGQLHPEQNITRMEFTALLVRCLGLDDIGMGTESGFPDVSADSWGAGYVKAAKDLNLIEGYDDGNFGPEDMITVTDAAKTIVSALKYSPRAEGEGGYPWGYLQIAREIGTLKGITDYEDLATRGEVSKMLFNSLEIEFMYGDATMLKCMNITKLKDKVTAVYGTSLDQDYGALKKNEIVVAGSKLRVKQPVDAAYVGSDTYIYIRDYMASGEEVLLVIPQRNEDVLVVSAEDIDKDTTLTQFVYWNGDNKRTVRLPDNLQIVYNGMALTSTSQLTPERLMPKSGSVSLVDADRNGIYESAFVKDYSTYVVQGVREDAIFDIYGNNITLDSDAEIIVLKDGEYLSLEDLKNGDVLSIASSLDGSRIEIIISDAKAEGTVTACGPDDNDRDYYVLDGNAGMRYSRTESYEAALKAGYQRAVNFDLKDSVVFYLNFFGEIAYAELIGEPSDNFKYGYLMKLDYNGSEVSGEEVFLKMITERNRVETLRIKAGRRVLFGRREGNKYNITRVEAKEIAAFLGTGDKVEDQMIRYLTDSNGDIEELYLLDRDNTENFSVSVSRGNRNFAYHAIQNTWYYDENTAVFHIPSSGLYPERISAGTPSKYFSNNSGYNVTLYDVDKNGYINLIVYNAAVTYYNDVYINYANSPLMLVTDVFTSLDEEGVSHLTVAGYQEGKIVQQYVSSKLDSGQVIQDIRPGVVVQYAVSSGLSDYAMTWDEEVGIILYNVIFDCNDRNQENFQMWNYGNIYAANARIQCAYGQVTRVDSPIIRTDLIAENSRNKQMFELSDGTNYYRYSTLNRKFEKIGSEDIQETDKIFIRTRYNYLIELVIVE